jgi:hypothetical protein
MKIYESFSLAKAQSSKGYDARLAERLLTVTDGFARVDFLYRGPLGKVSPPQPGVIQYVKATGGKWGKSSEQRFGAKLDGEALIVAIQTANIAAGGAQ